MESGTIKRIKDLTTVSTWYPSKASISGKFILNEWAESYDVVNLSRGGNPIFDDLYEAFNETVAVNDDGSIWMPSKEGLKLNDVLTIPKSIIPQIYWPTNVDSNGEMVCIDGKNEVLYVYNVNSKSIRSFTNAEAESILRTGISWYNCTEFKNIMYSDGYIFINNESECYVGQLNNEETVFSEGASIITSVRNGYVAISCVYEPHVQIYNLEERQFVFSFKEFEGSYDEDNDYYLNNPVDLVVVENNEVRLRIGHENEIITIQISGGDECKSVEAIKAQPLALWHGDVILSERMLSGPKHKAFIVTKPLNLCDERREFIAYNSKTGEIVVYMLDTGEFQFIPLETERIMGEIQFCPSLRCVCYRYYEMGFTIRCLNVDTKTTSDIVLGGEMDDGEFLINERIVILHTKKKLIAYERETGKKLWEPEPFTYDISKIIIKGLVICVAFSRCNFLTINSCSTDVCLGKRINLNHHIMEIGFLSETMVVVVFPTEIHTYEINECEITLVNTRKYSLYGGDSCLAGSVILGEWYAKYHFDQDKYNARVRLIHTQRNETVYRDMEGLSNERMFISSANGSISLVGTQPFCLIENMF
ncbi:hypothetical protein PCE1_003586 [Barthelona sp. PCE]